MLILLRNFRIFVSNFGNFVAHFYNFSYSNSSYHYRSSIFNRRFATHLIFTTNVSNITPSCIITTNIINDTNNYSTSRSCSGGCCPCNESSWQSGKFEFDKFGGWATEYKRLNFTSTTTVTASPATATNCASTGASTGGITGSGGNAYTWVKPSTSVSNKSVNFTGSLSNKW